MHDGTCPSCQGTEVYAARNGLALGENVRVGLRPHIDKGFRGAIRTHLTDDVWTYACASCGLVELRIHDPVATEFVRQRWVRVQPQPGAPA